MNPIFFGLRGSTSYVIGAMARDDPARHLSWITSPHGVVPGHLMIFDAKGQLRPAVIAGPSSGPPPAGQRCWSVTTAGTSVPLQASLFQWSWTVRLDYAGPAAVLALRLGGTVGRGDAPGRYSRHLCPARGGGPGAQRLPGRYPAGGARRRGVTGWHHASDVPDRRHGGHVAASAVRPGLPGSARARVRRAHRHSPCACRSQGADQHRTSTFRGSRPGPRPGSAGSRSRTAAGVPAELRHGDRAP